METNINKKGDGVSKKHSYGKFLAIVTIIVAVLSTVEGNLQHSLSPAMATVFAISGFIIKFCFMYLLTIWIADLIRRRGGIDRPENKKVRTIINIIFIILILGALLPFLGSLLMVKG